MSRRTNDKEFPSMKDICGKCQWAEQCHDENDKTCLLPEAAQEALQSDGD